LKVYRNLSEFARQPNAVVTIGTFDGVHRGHQEIIARLDEIAAQTGGQSVVLTFFPHPRMVLYPADHGLLLLNTLEERIDLLERFGVQHLVVYPFTLAFSRTSVTEYVRDLLVNALGTKRLVIGYDHHFGRNREGSLADLRELSAVYGFEVEEIPEQDIRRVAVSSTKIRKSLLAGDIATANEFLGHAYSLSGRVVPGERRGRAMGFPTANLQVEEDYKLIPGHGVYAVVVRIGGRAGEWKGALSIGTRPTFDDGAVSIEVYLLGFEGDLYGKRLTLFFKHRLRDEMKFASAGDLAGQMKKDVAETGRLLSGG
jgi:riboflavin kinase/FMN adenylyltransferase